MSSQEASRVIAALALIEKAKQQLERAAINLQQVSFCGPAILPVRSLMDAADVEWHRVNNLSREWHLRQTQPKKKRKRLTSSETPHPFDDVDEFINEDMQ